MWLLPLPLGAGSAGQPAIGAGPNRKRIADPSPARCAFCGVRSSKWQTRCALEDGSAAVCPLCFLACHLDRPRIDEEVALLWMPEMSQQAINAVMREIHMQLRLLNEPLHAVEGFRANTAQRRTLHNARAILAAGARASAMPLGAVSPSELGAALRLLSPAAANRRAVLLGGLRALPLGRVYEDGEDVYPDIVDTWLQEASQAEQSARAPSWAGGEG